MPMQCYVHVKSQFRGKKPVLPVRNFRLLYYPGILQWLQHLIIKFILSYLLVVAYGRLKTNDNFKLWALKVFAVAYERWSLTRGFQCSDLTEKLLVFWKTGRWGELVATGGLTVSPLNSYLVVDLQKMSVVRSADCIHNGVLINK